MHKSNAAVLEPRLKHFNCIYRTLQTWQVRLEKQKQPFCSIRPFTRKNGVYKKMFFDSASASLDCGKTKARHIAVHGLAHFGSKQIQAEYTRSFYGLDAAESSYHQQSSLEYWINYFHNGERRFRYLTTLEMKLKFNDE